MKFWNEDEIRARFRFAINVASGFPDTIETFTAFRAGYNANQQADKLKKDLEDSALLLGYGWQESLKAVNGSAHDFFPAHCARLAADNTLLRESLHKIAAECVRDWPPEESFQIIQNIVESVIKELDDENCETN